MNSKSIGKKIIGYLLVLTFPEFFIFLLQKAIFFFTKLQYAKDWKFYQKHIPSYFKHQVNLNLWRFEPSQWSFTQRGVHAREKMFKQCKVLDLCCGDGSYSFFFFSDIAGDIDAIDIESSAINYAKKNFNRSNINFQQIDVLNGQFPSNDYDVVVWNAGICYFTLNEIHSILAKIVKASKVSTIVCGMLPKANGHIDHKTEFSEMEALKNIFIPYFEKIEIRAIIDGVDDQNLNFYFTLSKPYKEA